MKKKILISLISFLIGGVIFGGIGVVFGITYNASNITYTPIDNTWNVTTVGQAINDLALSKTSDNYSTTETVVGTWIDGKPIYQQTISFQGKGNSVNIKSMPEVDQLIRTFGYIKEAGNTWDIVNTGCRIGLNNTTKMLHWQGAGWGDFTAHVTVQYTKADNQIN